MFSITSAQLDALFAAWLYPMIRILGLMGTAPVFSNQAIPRRIRLAAGLALTAALAASLPPAPTVQGGGWVGWSTVVEQFLIGSAMGLTMRVVLAAVDLAGEMMGLQMGLSFATFFDPNTSAQTAVLAELIGLLSTLCFLAVNGHLMLIEAFALSFELLPIGGVTFGGQGWMELARLGAAVFGSGLLIALPVIAALLITNIALAVLTRAAPQLNIFAIGFPITLAVGILVLLLTLNALAPVLLQLFEAGFDHISLLFRIWGHAVAM